ncbi:MAG: glutaminase [Saprospiraceae bacterium]|nr:glutaminase [Saprospiraceae bacterium]
MNYQLILDELFPPIKNAAIIGEVASYIPELAHVRPEKFGVHLCCLQGGDYFIGDHSERFSIQSISKVLSLAMAFKIEGESIWKRVGVEPSGNPFNSLIQLEYENGKPRNPLINSGALVICDILISHLDNPLEELLSFIRKISGQSSITINEKVAASEKAFGHRNAALINLMKSFGNIENDIDQVLDFYFYQCAIEMSCLELARTMLLFSNRGKILSSGEEMLTSSQTKRLNAIMQSCGFYDEAGEFTYRVGLPGKSGVGGGIVAIHPGEYSVAVWSPPLNPKGNSARGMRFLEDLTTKTGLSIF